MKLLLTIVLMALVEHVSYDGQHTPTVTIKGKDYNLVYNTWGHNQDNGDTIEVGDIMIKKKGELSIKLIEHNRKDTANFSHK